jgi:ribonuclease HI
VGEPIRSLDSVKFVAHCESRRPTTNVQPGCLCRCGSLGNPGPAGVGVVIDGADNGTIKITKPIGRQDNNVAEYLALLEALQCAVDLGAKTLHVFSDSEVVVKQMTGEYTCRSTQLYSLNWTCRKLARSLDFSISHVTRENNVEANRLANSAARKKLK